MLKKTCPIHFLLIFFATLLFPSLSTGEFNKEEMTIAIPEELMVEFINDTLPVKITRKKSFSGVIWIESIDRLKLGNDKISFSMELRGENITYKRNIGKKPVEMQFGDVRLAFGCEAAIRYDKGRNILYVKPEINQEKTDEQVLVPLLASLIEGREFPIEIQKMEPIITKIGDKSLTINMDISNIFILNSILFIGITPKVNENGSKGPEGE